MEVSSKRQNKYQSSANGCQAEKLTDGITSTANHISLASQQTIGGINEQLTGKSRRQNATNLLFGKDENSPISHPTVDLLMATFCFISIHYLYLGNLDFTGHRLLALYGSVFFIVLTLFASGTYVGDRVRNLNRELVNLSVCFTCAFAAVGLLAFLTKSGQEVSRFWVTVSMFTSFISFIVLRIIRSIYFIRGNGLKNTNIVLCGSIDRVNSVFANVCTSTTPTMSVDKVFTLPPLDIHSAIDTNNIFFQSKIIIEFIENRRKSDRAIDQVWIAVPNTQLQWVEKLSEFLYDSAVDVCFIPDQLSQRIVSGDVTQYKNTTIVNISEITLSPGADKFKRVFDFLIAQLAIIVLSIPMLIIACLIKLDSRGPILFKQKRNGMDGQEIEVLKFRTMLEHNDNIIRQATKNDKRVTRLGKFLRSSSLDELPQLFNVLNGSMSLVGPRPHATAHNEHWRNQIYGYMSRHKVRPGITGWAQVNGWRGETDTFFKMQQRVEYDLDYIRKWTPMLDVKILLFTLVSIIRDKNAY